MASHYWTGQYDFPVYDVICKTHSASVQQGLSTGPLSQHSTRLSKLEQSTLDWAGPVEHTPLLLQFSPVAHSPA